MRVRSGILTPWTWGPAPDLTGAGERELARLGDSHQCAWRCVLVAAPIQLTWAWLSQIRFAPYSYDWIDNRGRPSPRHLQSSQSLRPGDDVTIGTVHDVRNEGTCRIARITTSDTARRRFALEAMVYGASAAGAEDTHLWCVLALARPTSTFGRATHEALAWGDLVMMRRQLLNLKRYAERDARNDLTVHHSPRSAPGP